MNDNNFFISGVAAHGWKKGNWFPAFRLNQQRPDFFIVFIMNYRWTFILLPIFFISCFKKYSGRIDIDGSSSVYPVTEAVAEEFRVDHSDIRVTVGVSGTGGGFKKFARGETDISNASRPIKAEEASAAVKAGNDFIEIPVAYDGLAVVVSPQNDFVEFLTVAELKKIWEPAAQGKIKSWAQVRQGFPDIPLRLYGAGTSSGTYDYFTEAITGKSKSSRGDYTASEDDNVLVQGVSSDKGALGYFGLAYYMENKTKLKLVGIDNGKGVVFPSDSTVTNGVYAPLSRPEFIYVNARSADRPEVKSFVKFYMEQATALVKEVGYVPLPPDVYALSYQRFLQKRTGSLFANVSTVGADLVELMKQDTISAR
jgi:phosphate transport system substrate-binding protein